MQLKSMMLTIERDFFPSYFFVILYFCTFSQNSILYPIPSLFPISNKSFAGNDSFGDYSRFYMGLPDFYAIDSNSQVFSMIEFGLCFVCLWLAVEENIGRQGGGAGVRWENESEGKENLVLTVIFKKIFASAWHCPTQIFNSFQIKIYLLFSNFNNCTVLIYCIKLN